VNPYQDAVEADLESDDVWSAPNPAHLVSKYHADYRSFAEREADRAAGREASWGQAGSFSDPCDAAGRES